MPIHDWNCVDAGVFHDFHQAWAIEIRNCLNDGLLPDNYYALAEQVVEGPIPDVVTLERRTNGDTDPDISNRHDGGRAAVALAERAPTVQHTHESQVQAYADRATRVAIRHVNGDEVACYIEIHSPGNKQSEAALRKFCEKLAHALRCGCHALVVDLHRPTPRDPQGIHARFWQDYFSGADAPPVTDERPLTLVAYRSDLCPTAYFEPTAVGLPLVDMPAFLTPDLYVNVPLESTYQAAWRGVPRRWKEVIEAAAGNA